MWVLSLLFSAKCQPEYAQPVRRSEQGRTQGRGSSAPHPTSRHLKPHSHTSWGSRLRVVLLALPLPLKGGRGLAPGQTPRLGAAVGFYKARDRGGLFLPWQIPGSLGTLEPLTLPAPLSRAVSTSLGLATHIPTVVSLRGLLPADAGQM